MAVDLTDLRQVYDNSWKMCDVLSALRTGVHQPD
jgi:hypothetical protein